MFLFHAIYVRVRPGNNVCLFCRGYADRVTWANLHPQKLIATLKRMQNGSFVESSEGTVEQAYFDAQPFITFLNKVITPASFDNYASHKLNHRKVYGCYRLESKVVMWRSHA